MEKNPIKTLLTNPTNYSYEGYIFWTNVYIIILARVDAPSKIFSVVLTSTYYLLFHVEQKTLNKSVTKQLDMQQSVNKFLKLILTTIFVLFHYI